jgi:hypothetical protein
VGGIELSISIHDVPRFLLSPLDSFAGIGDEIVNKDIMNH